MKVSAKAKYACYATFELAATHADGQPVRVKAIADAHGIPQRFLVQILLQLKAAGLVMSLRGASGGYQLARPPEEISVADVIHAIDRPQPHGTAKERAGSPAARAFQAVWNSVQEAEQHLLEETTFAELVRRSRENNALSYQI